MVDIYRAAVKNARPIFDAFFVLSGTASSLICESSSSVTSANRTAILFVTYASLTWAGGLLGGE